MSTIDEKIARGRVLVIGVGGLGAPAAAALAAAGVGTLGLIDPDAVEVSNLHRQPLYTGADIGRPKVEVAAERLRGLAPALRVATWRAGGGPRGRRAAARRRARGRAAGRRGDPPARRRAPRLRERAPRPRHAGGALAHRSGRFESALPGVRHPRRRKESRPMSYVKGLRCRECGAETPVAPLHVCETCFGPYEVQYDYAAIRRVLTREKIAARAQNLWRYRELLPIEGEPRVGLHSGMTPLVRADRLAAVLGVRELWVKDDSVNHPTFSYKDRVVSVAISKAIEFGFETVSCASTGNLANSVSAHAARAGLACYIFIPDDLEQGKVIGSAIYGPRTIAVRGNYDDVNRLCSEVADKYGWAFVNINVRPYYTEGAKTYGFEIAEQLGWR